VGHPTALRRLNTVAALVDVVESDSLIFSLQSPRLLRRRYVEFRKPLNPRGHSPLTTFGTIVRTGDGRPKWVARPPTEGYCFDRPWRVSASASWIASPDRSKVTCLTVPVNGNVVR
jgi:hypothetical protein